MSEDDDSGLVYVDDNGEKYRITQSDADLLSEVRFSNKLKVFLALLIVVLIVVTIIGFFQTNLVIGAMRRLACPA